MSVLGEVMVWTVAAGTVAAVPGGVISAARAVLAPRWCFSGLGDRLAQLVGGLALAASAAYLCAWFGPAFVAVVL